MSLFLQIVNCRTPNGLKDRRNPQMSPKDAHSGPMSIITTGESSSDPH